jgi:hypothetical protein
VRPGDVQQAWEELIERYAPLVWATCTWYRLSNHDIKDVGQSVWLLLVAQFGKLRERRCPAGRRPPQTGVPPGRHADRKSQQLESMVDDAPFADERALDEEILIAERNATLGIPIGSIGPQRARCLKRLRQAPALTAFGESEFSIGSLGGGHGA